jgi:ASC-1-like (ASCH) protein
MDLTLPLKREYFEAIKSGDKTEEYRLVTPYWTKRIDGREYDNIILTLGYPKRDDASRRIVKKWKGYTIKTIQGKLFGDLPVSVYAIDVS